MTTQSPRSQTDIDLFAPDAVADPYPLLAQLRAAGPAVYSTVHDVYVLTRYDDVRNAAENWQSFTSSHGAALTPERNAQMEGSVLSTDPPEHDQLRAVLSDKLAPRGLAKVRDQMATYAERLVTEVTSNSSFDGVVDIARVYPINVVADLVGLPQEGRDTLRPGADAMFAGFGPNSGYALEKMPELMAYVGWMGTMADRSKLLPGGWGEAVMDAVDEGRIDMIGAIRTISAYLTAGMDTTVNATGALLKLFADRPDVWESIKADPTLAAAAFEEILRLESPVVGFFRVATRDVTFGETTVPAGAKVLLHWAAANRDPAKYPDPDEFRLERNPVDHVAFGYGVHGCAGQGLARMEVTTLVETLARHVDTLTAAGPAVRGRNPVIRGYDSVPLTCTPRGV